MAGRLARISPIYSHHLWAIPYVKEGEGKGEKENFLCARREQQEPSGTRLLGESDGEMKCEMMGRRVRINKTLSPYTPL